MTAYYIRMFQGGEMMYKKYRMRAVLMAFIILISMTGTGCRTETDMFSGYASYVQMADEYGSQLSDAGYSENEIENFLDTIFDDTLVQLSQLTAEELADQGLDTDEISQIQSYESKCASDEDMISLIPGLALSLTAQAGETVTTLQISWSWDSSPTDLDTDMAVIIWQAFSDEGRALAAETVFADCEVLYVNTVSGESKLMSTEVIYDDISNNIFAEISMDENVSDDMVGYAKAGTIVIRLVSQGEKQIQSIAVSGGYGHASMTDDITYAGFVSGGVSFLPELLTERAAISGYVWYKR